MLLSIFLKATTTTPSLTDNQEFFFQGKRKGGLPDCRLRLRNSFEFQR